MPSNPQPLCTLEEIPDGGARGFGNESANDLFAVRRGRQVYVYRNRCPHAGTPLNWMPNRFLTLERDRILCATHGARFEIETGRCTAGPCPGQYLTAVSSEVLDGMVWVVD